MTSPGQQDVNQRANGPERPSGEAVLPAAPAAAVTAETILQGYKNLGDGVIEMTLPLGVTIHEAGEILNRAAREKGIEIPVFYEGQKDFWLTNEANKDFRTEPGQACRFKIPTDSLSKTKAEQESDYGAAAPLGIVSLAEACERYNTNNKGTLFKDASGAKVWARGSAPGFALDSFSDLGVYVYVYGDSDGSRDADVAFASLVSARN